MKTFEYYNPNKISEALLLLQGGKSKIISGGTDLVIKMRHEPVEYETIINVKHIPEMCAIVDLGETISIGAASSFSAIMASPLIKKYALALAQAASEVGSPQIRALGTIGGNLANAAAAADSIPALLALDAVLVLEKYDSKREMRVEDFFVGLGKTKLETDEMITAIKIPKRENQVSYFRKLGRRQAMAISRLTIAISAWCDEKNPKNIGDIAIALGAVNTYPFRARGIEEKMKGKVIGTLTRDNIMEELSDLVVEMIGGRSSVHFKKEAVKGIAYDALDEIFQKLEQQ